MWYYTNVSQTTYAAGADNLTVGWTALQHCGHNNLGLWCNGLPSNIVALITSDCGVIGCPLTSCP